MKQYGTPIFRKNKNSCVQVQVDTTHSLSPSSFIQKCAPILKFFFSKSNTKNTVLKILEHFEKV